MLNRLRDHYWTAAFALTLGACGGGSSTDGQSGSLDGLPNGAAGCIPGEQFACACTDGTTSAQICSADGTGVGPCQCNAPTGGPAPAATGSVPDGLPCEVAALVETSCHDCHGAQPKFGAPMSLLNASDFRAPSTVDGETVAQRVLARISDSAKPMPPPPALGLDDAQKAILQSWVDAGTYGTTCGATTPVGGPTTPVDPTDPTTPVDPTDPTTPVDPTDPTTPVDPVDPPPPDGAVTCYEFRANDGIGGSYDVPQTPDLYQCFTFAAPWGATPVQLTSAKTIIDNDVVIHHWILYNTSGAVPDGASGGCSGAHPDAAFIAGWAPGGSDSEMPPDVGLEVAGQGFTLEVHYNNSAGQQVDASGVEVCVTDQMRPNVAAVHWLGTESINLPGGGDAVGNCNPSATGPVTILSSSPHMHLQGRHMKTVINRAAGGQDILIDVPFDFSSQVTYQTPETVYPGDTLTTTCTFGGAAYFGQGTNEEMCYNFVTAYPAGGLSAGFSFARQYGCTGL